MVIYNPETVGVVWHACPTPTFWVLICMIFIMDDIPPHSQPPPPPTHRGHNYSPNLLNVAILKVSPLILEFFCVHSAPSI